MSPDHQALLTELRQTARPIRGDRPEQNDSYGGSGRPFYNVSVPARRAMVRRWLAAHKADPAEAGLALIDSLFGGESHEEKTLAALLLRESPRLRRAASPADVDRWLGQVRGWAEVDSICQNAFTPEEMMADWPAWKALIEALAASANINKRRAALVLLTGPVHYSDDPRFRDLALAVIDRLMAERDILITKAVSWLLRAMVTRHREAVERCLAEQAASLPKIAIRETRTKLTTGTKSGKSGSTSS
ncbi:MAG TPA: DNA alkylation repair protein [Caulobacteraceae bacterium]|jgi:3-methyladenine DNA glycosylase AlkD|nr:DNA alkylation repair protein [Caulobacteraceae bacterium]